MITVLGTVISPSQLFGVDLHIAAASVKGSSIRLGLSNKDSPYPYVRNHYKIC